jgi:hypothetical protein
LVSVRVGGNEVRMTIRSMFVALMMLSACGEPGGEGSQGGGTGAQGGGSGSQGGGTANVTCSATGALTDEISNGRTVVTASGTITCTGEKQIDVQTCLQWNTSGTFEDVQCQSLSGTATSLSATSKVSCIGTKLFRTRVTGNAEFVSEARSITCQ